jgi:arylsulfatase A-like enzyme/Flp pilus assembly protein TadD
MPALDQLARESLVFEQAISVGPLTLPSHASILTALYPPRHGVRDNHLFSLAEEVPAYPALLKAGGYATGAFVSAIVLDRRYGLARGFDEYDDHIDAVERPAADTLSRAEQWIAAARRPFFAWVHLFEPHAPYRSGSYALEVAIVDAALAKFFDALRSRGTWDSTIVSVTADHGESLGEHGELTHGYFVYDSTLKIPWLVHVPGRRPQRFAHQVRLVDVLPTLVALAGAPVDSLTVDGVNLVPSLGRTGSPNLEAYSETFLPRHQFNWSELRSLRTERGKYIGAPSPELYDLPADPREERNVLITQADIARSMSRQLAALERSTPPRARQATDVVLAEQFMSLGYIGYSPPASAASGPLPDPKDKLEIYRLTMDALELSEGGNHAGALARLREAKRLDASVAQVHFLEGVILGNVGRYAEAAAALERTMAVNPRHVTARFKLALAYLRTDRAGRAEQVLLGVLADEPRNVRAMHNLATIAYSRGDLERAETLERQALAVDPQYVEAWNTLGAIYIVRKEPERAVEALDRATRIDSRNGQAFSNYALALRALGRRDEAKAAARRACELDARWCGRN